MGLKLVLRKGTASGLGEVAFIEAPGGQLELVMPGPGIGTPAPRPASDTAGLRHITLAYSDIKEMIGKLAEQGVTIIEEPRLAHASEVVEQVAFVLDPDGIVVELAQRARGR
jgi:glyoxylase I family protein